VPAARRITLATLTLVCLVATPLASTAAAPKKPTPPTISSVTPLRNIEVGDQLTIRGRNFVSGIRRNTVVFKAGKGAAIAVRAGEASRTAIKVTIPRSVARRIVVKRGVAQPTRFALRVRSGRLSTRYTPKRLSPTIAPAATSAVSAEEHPACAALACAPASAPVAAAVAATPPPPGALVFEDQFDGPSVNTAKWATYNSPGHAGNGLRRPSAFTQENGQLVITAAWDGSNIVSGGMSHRYNQLYGSYEVRVRVDPDPSGQLSGVALTWPMSEKQVPDGEMDIWEPGHSAKGRNPWMTFIHRTQDGVNDSQVWLTHNSDAAEWHTVRMDWTPTAIRVYVDGVLDGQITDPARIPTTPHHLCLQLDAFSNKPLAAPVRMNVDWVRVYR
jgi:hypothetical protein